MFFNNIGSRNGLTPAGDKPSSEPMQTNQWKDMEYSIHIQIVL